MEHLKMKTADMASENFEKLKALFPNCVTESLDKDGNPVRAIDKDLLMQEINSEVVEGQKERYQFNWPGKRDAIRKANAPTTMTLRPCKDESVDFDNTQNLYIEGDNLEVLKLLQNNYLGKVKMIYIDPPYNTGNDFVYNDNFKQDSETFLETSGMFDEDGNMTLQNFEKNSESNGRFHTDWLNMMYPRLKVARNLLSDDGVIFISIGDDEEANLIKIGDEIFGEKNFVASICHKHRGSMSNDRIISENHNHLVFYAKSMNVLFAQHLQIGDDPDLSGFNLEDDNGKYKLTPVDGPGGAKKGNPHYEFLGVEGYWRYSKETMQEKYNQGLIVRTKNGLQQKYYESKAALSRKTVSTWWDGDFLTSSATSELSKMMGGKIFDNPKNPNLIIRMLKMITHFDKDSLILDFFSGSATTAHAVMQLNAEDNGNRKFICVQLPEVTSEDSEAYKAGYKSICEIGKERIRRAGKKIKDEMGLTAQNLDIGFRVLKLAESNMNDVYYKPADIDQGFLDKLDTNIKRDRTPMDLLFQVMLECDLELSSKIEERQINGKQVFFVNDKELVACFDENIDEATITEIAKLKPYYFVMRDSSLATDNVADNFEQLWNAYSKDTIRKVL
ncbi:site-specific DNA-methyltransferase [Fibrobacter sp.]|uniref:site-specific DNA-methyltransferase n=1 Tax=Fibrobacter sp. TaxID=35828 RepID=UPI0025C069EB|nr:site-specific DNA-methyltransferase [Fibrobacter sp.]MCI6437908.1 site-specific DNA-methyltransferase [Fibrobacter sp.]